MTEFWKPVPNFPGYRVSSEGRIWSDKTNRILKNNTNQNGYISVMFRRDGESIRRYIHQIVVEAFIGPRPDDFQLVRHLNGDQLDNKPRNLAYGTFKQNSQDIIRHGTHRRIKSNAKLTVDQVRDIRDLIRQGELRQSDIGAMYGVTNCTVSRINTGYTWPALDIERIQR